MSKAFDDVCQRAMELPDDERVALATVLIDSLGDDPAATEAAWAEEIQRRMQAVDSGEVETIPWETVRAEMWARIDAHRR